MDSKKVRTAYAWAGVDRLVREAEVETLYSISSRGVVPLGGAGGHNMSEEEVQVERWARKSCV